jgi:hypothetical protein
MLTGSLLALGALLAGGQPAGAASLRGGPIVAIHDSEFTRALESMPATNAATPTGPGTSGFEWWPTNWHYFVMPESLKEALRSDGTSFDVLGDADIEAGQLLDTNGHPRYPILISLASEAIADDEIAQLTNYVAAGGILFAGSSAFTRFTNGAPRGDFALAGPMGLHLASPSLRNWTNNATFSKLVDHPLITHIPAGSLTWQMPSAADEISWGTSPAHPLPSGHSICQVSPADATVIAQGDAALPYLAVKAYGQGTFIYCAAMQPLLGHGGWAPGMYAYGIFRNAIQTAFATARLPLPRLSPWPYPYDAALNVRHDFEDYRDMITNIESSARYEYTNGAKGDYYFCTGTLRVEMTNSAAVIASLRRAVTNYGATIAPHNGGLANPTNSSLVVSNYDYWHWGPDEALDTKPAGYATGAAYAQASISNAFKDVQGWLAGISNGLHGWVAPYFNATREASYSLQQQLGVTTAGEQKLSPFPHWTLSTQTSGKRYPFVSLPVSDWFVGSQVAQSMEAGHTALTEQALVDYYYNLGALVNLYCHSSSDGTGLAGVLASNYVTYSMSKPRIWPTNASGVYSWWVRRTNALVTPSFALVGSQAITTLNVARATDPQTAVEVLLPQASPAGLQVFTNGALASGAAYRLTGQTVKVLVGTAVTNAQVIYDPTPLAQNDTFTLTSGTTLNIPAPGVLTNDATGAGTNLTALLVTGPSQGALTLNPDGSFAYTPATNFYGVDTFTYEDYDGVSTGNVATVTLLVNPNVSVLYSDDFTRASDPAPLTPWTVQSGAWSITQGQVRGGTNALQSYAFAYLNNSWSNYTVQADLRFPAGAYGGGIGGRVNPLTGAHYAAWIYPEGSPGGSSVLKLVKFQNWSTFGYSNVVGAFMQQVPLPGVGTNWHTVELAFQGTQIKIYYDAVLLITATDTEAQPYLTGGITLDMWTAATPYVMAADNVLVTTPRADQVITFAPPATQTYGVAPFTPDAAASSGLPVAFSIVSGPATVSNNLIHVTAVGTVTVKATQVGNANYNPAPSVTQSFAVGPAPLTVTANNLTMPYGAVPPVLTFAPSGFVNGDTAGVLSGAPALSTTAQTNSPVGPYPVSISQGSLSAANYTFSFVNGTLTVIPAPLTVAAFNSTRSYGAANPAFSGSISGIQNNDPITASYSTTAGPASSVGAYAIVPSLSGSLTNYSVTSSNGTLAVTPAPLLITPDNQTRPYGSPNPTFTGTITGIQNADPVTATYSTPATSSSPVGSYSIVASPAGPLSNYSVTLSAASLTVTPVTLIVSADNKTRVYGTNNPPLTFTASGFVNGDDPSVLTGSPALSTPALTNSPVGVEPIQISLDTLSNANYSFSFTNGTLTITPTPGGLFFSDDFSRPLNPGTLAPWIADEGAWAVTNGVLQGTGLTNNYSFAYVNASWTDFILQGQVQFSTSNAYGGGLGGRLNPLTGAHYGAWVYPENSTGGSHVLKLVKFEAWNTWSGTPMAQAVLPAVGTNWHTLKLAFLTNQISVFYDGTQVINATDNGFDGQPAFLSGGVSADMYTDANGSYALSVDNVVASINKPALLITANNTNRTYGAPNPSFTGAILGLKNGDNISASYSTTADPTSPVGTYAIVPAAVDPASLLTNYFLTLSNGLLTITPATLSVTADNLVRGYGTTNPVLTGALVGVQNGDNIAASYSTTAGASSFIGSYPIVPALADPGNKLTNYSVTTNNGTLTIVPAADGTFFSDSFSPSIPGDLSPWVIEEGAWAVTNGVLLGFGLSNNYSYAYLNSSWTDYSVEGQVRFSSTSAWGGGLGGRLNPANGAHYAAWFFPEGSQGGSTVLKLIKFEGWHSWSGNSMATLPLPSVGTNWHTLKLAFVTNQISLYCDGVQLTTVTDNGFDSVQPFLSGGISADLYTDPTGSYSLSFDNIAVKLVRPTLTVTANSATRAYGAANPAFTGTVSGLQNGDNITASWLCSANPGSAVGSYPIIPSLNDPNHHLTNYNLVISNGTLAVTPVPLLVKANDAGRAYGQANPIFSASFNGFVNGEDSNVLSGALDFTTSADTNSPVGTYPIQVTGLTATNYSLTFSNGTLTVTPAALVASADARTKVYGTPLPAFTGTLTGVQNGDNITLSFSTSADAASSVGSYNIIPVLNDPNSRLGNYNTTLHNGTLAVTPAPLLVTADNHTRAYGAPDPALTAIITGFVNGDTAGSSLTGSPSLSTSATATSPVANYSITPAVGSLVASNYTFTFTNGTLAVTPASLLGTADSKARLYGQTNPAFTVTYSGFVNNENAGIVTGTLIARTTADANSPVGIYPITASGQSAPNYYLTYAPGTLTVGPAPLLVKANDASRGYGHTNPVFSASLSGFVNGEDSNVLSGALDLTTSADTNSPVGTYPIEVTGLISTNYSLTFSNGTLTITPYALSVIADSFSRTYGAANPTLTGKVTGVQNGDKITATYSTSADTNSPVGTYNIVPALADPNHKLTNYSVTSSNGTLTVSAATLIASADNKLRLYGQTNPVFTVTYTGFVNNENAGILSGTLIASTTANVNSAVGSYPITVSGQSAPNYTIAYAPGTLTVGPAPLLVKANDASRAYGQSNPLFSAGFSGFVNGEDSNVLSGALDFTTSADTNSPVGTYSIAVTGLTSTNYSLTFSNGTLAITPYALLVIADSFSRTYGAANPSFTGTLTGVQNGDNITATYSTSAGTNSPVGTYGIVPALADPNHKLTNYSVTSSNGTLTVTPATLVASADNKTKVYSQAMPALTGNLSGVENGDNIVLTYSTSADAESPVGTYDIVPELSDPDARLGNYTVALHKGTLTITAANSSSALASSANPALQGSNVTFTATVSALPPATATPDGSIQFFTNGVAFGGTVPLSSGLASISTALLPVGSNTVTAVYAGNGNFLPTTNTLIQIVQIVTAVPQTPITVGITNNGDGTITATFQGSANARYLVQITSSLTPPTAWSTVATNLAGPDGKWIFTDSVTNAPQRFFRPAMP